MTTAIVRAEAAIGNSPTKLTLGTITINGVERRVSVIISDGATPRALTDQVERIRTVAEDALNVFVAMIQAQDPPIIENFSTITHVTDNGFHTASSPQSIRALSPTSDPSAQTKWEEFKKLILEDRTTAAPQSPQGSPTPPPTAPPTPPATQQQPLRPSSPSTPASPPPPSSPVSSEGPTVEAPRSGYPTPLPPPLPPTAPSSHHLSVTGRFLLPQLIVGERELREQRKRLQSNFTVELTPTQIGAGTAPQSAPS